MAPLTRELADGDVLAFGHREARVLHTPGTHAGLALLLRRAHRRDAGAVQRRHALSPLGRTHRSLGRLRRSSCWRRSATSCSRCPTTRSWCPATARRRRSAPSARATPTSGGARRRSSTEAPVPDARPPRLSLARLPTPLERSRRIGPALGVNLYWKRDDLTGVELSGNKIRKLEFLFADAEAQRRRHRDHLRRRAVEPLPRDRARRRATRARLRAAAARPRSGGAAGAGRQQPARSRRRRADPLRLVRRVPAPRRDLRRGRGGSPPRRPPPVP